jgi:acyl-CoA reductase-like NAD-dependent aldehyde dehydrogenase
LHLYTKDLATKRYVVEHARWGTIFVNKPLTVPVEMPHSGMASSGNTFNQSFFKIYQYLVPKHIVVGDQID